MMSADNVQSTGFAPRRWSVRLVVGTIFIALGGAWTLDNLGVLDADSVLQWWPLLLIAYGALRITGVDGCKRPLSGGIFAFAGAWILLNNLNVIDISVFDLWPLFLIFAGLSLIQRGAHTVGAAESDSYPRPFAMMGGNERRLQSQELTGFEATAVAGGVDVDLCGAKPRTHDVHAEVFALWGGIDITVPRNWRVVCEATPIMGGVENKALPPIEPIVATLHVRGLLLMGGLEIKSEGA